MTDEEKKNVEYFFIEYEYNVIMTMEEFNSGGYSSEDIINDSGD